MTEPYVAHPMERSAMFSVLLDCPGYARLEASIGRRVLDDAMRAWCQEPVAVRRIGQYRWATELYAGRVRTIAGWLGAPDPAGPDGWARYATILDQPATHHRPNHP